MYNKPMEKRTEKGLKAKREYIAAYDKENRASLLLKLNKVTEADIIEQLSQQDNKQGYIKKLIREDIKKGGK